MSIPKIRAVELDTYHGLDVLPLRAGDPLPTPRAPTRYAVRVYPDLARYLLTFNHEHNRHMRKRAVARYADDMRAGLWLFIPEPLVFSVTGKLQNGQHRLIAVTEYGGDVWMIFDFGWPDEIITAIDRGAPRTNADAFEVDSIPAGRAIAAAIVAVARYDAVKGGTRGFSGLPTPSAQAALAIYRDDPDGWAMAEHSGSRIYKALDKGLTPSLWSAAYRIIARVRPEDAPGYFAAIAEGTEPPGSATRDVADWFRRRGASSTRTGDDREPLEVILRGFNAHIKGARVSMPRVAGFQLSYVR